MKCRICKTHDNVGHFGKPWRQNGLPFGTGISSFRIPVCPACSPPVIAVYQCSQCSTDLHWHGPGVWEAKARFCTTKCRDAYRYRQRRARLLPRWAKCEHCNCDIYPKRKTMRFCSPRCRVAHNRS